MKLQKCFWSWHLKFNQFNGVVISNLFLSSRKQAVLILYLGSRIRYPKTPHHVPHQTPIQSPSSNSSVGDLLGDFAAPPVVPAPTAATAAADSGGDLWGDFTSASPTASVKSSGNWEQF